MKIKIEAVAVKEKSQRETMKDDGSSKESHGAKLKGTRDGCPIVVSIKCEAPIPELQEGQTGLVITIDNPQTRLTDAPDDVEGKKRKPDVMVEDKSGKKPKGSKAIEDLGKPTPDEVQANIEAELKRQGEEADRKLAAVKKEGKQKKV